MECVPGDIFWSDFPSADTDGYKERLVMIVADVFGSDVIVCMVTHRKSHFDVCIEIGNEDLDEGRLSLNPSYIRPVRLFTTNPKVFRGKVGRVKAHILDSVRESLAKKFS